MESRILELVVLTIEGLGRIIVIFCPRNEAAVSAVNQGCGGNDC